MVDRSNPAFKHGHASREGFSPEYHSWACMIQRCTNPRRESWAHYGGRGIAVCEEWLDSFDQFLADMGPRPAGTSLDRIDVNEGYSPSNCRWATASEQSRNRRRRTDVYRREIEQLILQGIKMLPDIVYLTGLHGEVVKKELRRLAREGKVVLTRVPSGTPRGKTLLCEHCGE